MICRFPTAFSELWWTRKKRRVEFCHIRSIELSLLNVVWKLCVHTTNDVQTSKPTQHCIILACCWCHWCRFWWFVIFQLLFLNLMNQKKRRVQFCHIRCVWAFSLLNVVWKLCVHTTNNVQTSKPTQHCIKLAYCWCHWCRFWWFVVFQLLFLNLMNQKKSDV